MMGWYNDGIMGAGGWLAMFVLMSLFWGALIVAGAMLVRGTKGRPGREDAGAVGPPNRDPVEILDERFARGELDSDEYDAREAVLLGARYRSRPTATN